MIDFLDQSPLARPLIFDSHAHYDDAKFDGIRHELLSALPKHGVTGAITCGCDGASSLAAMKLAEQYHYLYFAAGIHPENIQNSTSLAEIKHFLSHKKHVLLN